jgi:hypothetical protein
LSNLYSASLTKSSLKVPESRIIARLLLERVDETAWKRAILDENVLQKRSPSTAKTFAENIRHRLLTMKPDLWELIRDGSPTVATQTVLAATLKHSRLLADFFDQVIREHARQFKTTLSDRDWADFIEECRARDPNVGKWTPVVIAKLRQVVFRILGEAEYVDSAKMLKLQRVAVAAPVARCLEDAGDGEILRLMRVMS